MRQIKPRAWFYGYLILATVFLAILAFFANHYLYLPGDLSIARSVQSFRPPWFDFLMRAVSWPGYPPQVYVWSFAIPVVLFLLRRRWEAVMQLFATVGVGIFGYAIKFLVDRPRPTTEFVRIIHSGLEGGKMSFPAGHVEAYVAIFGFLFFLSWSLLPKRSWWRRVQLFFYSFMIFLIGISRIYSGEHWPSDALGGYLVGSIWLAITVEIYFWGGRKNWPLLKKLTDHERI